MTFEEYIAEVESVHREHPHWRRGQTHFNVLSKCRPELAERFRMTSCDPFYDDDRVPAFLEAAKSQWGES